MRSISSLRTASAVVGMFGLMAVGMAQTVPTPDWTADGTTLSGHATGAVLDTRITPNGNTVASVSPNASNPGGNEVRVRQAGNGTFLWTENVGNMPPVGLPKIGFSNDSARIYYVATDASANRTIQIRNATTGAATGGGPIAIPSPANIVNRFAFSRNGTLYAYQDGTVRSGGLQHQVVVRNVSGNGVVATLGFGSGGVFPGIRDFEFSPDSSEIIVALTDGSLSRININTGATVSLSTTLGSETNRIVLIPGVTATFMLVRNTGTGGSVQRRNVSDGALVRAYTNLPVAAANNVIFQEFDTTSSEVYMMGVVGAFDFLTYVRVSNGDPVASYDLRRSGQPVSDSRMQSVASNSSAFFAGAASTTAARVLAVPRPIYLVSTPTTVIGGNSIMGTVTLPGPAPTGGFLVTLADDNANVTTPASVTVPAGASTANFNMTTVNVDADATVTVTATFPTGNRTAQFQLTRIGVSSVTVNPDPSLNSAPITGTVTLNVMTSADRVVNLTYSPGGVLSVAPMTVTVPGGATSANFTMRAARTETGASVTVTAEHNGISANKPFNVLSTLLNGVDIYPHVLLPNQRYIGVVRLNRTVATDTSVNITSSLPSMFPAMSVTVPAGAKHATFTGTFGNNTTFRVITLTSVGTQGETRTDTIFGVAGANALAAGRNANGALADGTSLSRPGWSAIRQPSTIKKVGSMVTSSLFLRTDGTVWAVGLGTFGQNGNGTSGAGAILSTPTQIPGLTNVVDIVTTQWSAFAITNTGQVFAWGRNNAGQLGVGNTVNQLTPVLVGGASFGTNIVSIAAGQAHTMFLDNMGRLWVAGSTANGRLGLGAVAGVRNSPVQVMSVPGKFVSIAAGADHSAAIHEDGTVYVWGRNTDGQLADGANVDLNVPTSRPFGRIRQIAGGGAHTLFVQIPHHGLQSQVFTAGANADGQLGRGSTIPSNTLVGIAGLAGSQWVAAGTSHSVAWSPDRVSTFGDNSFGQIGEGTFVDRLSPRVIIRGSSYGSVFAGPSATIMIGKAPTPTLRRELILANDSTQVLRSFNPVTNSFTAITGNYTAGRTIIGGGDVSTATLGSEGVSYDSATRQLYYFPVVGNAIGAEVAMGAPLPATEDPVFVGDANADLVPDIYVKDSVTRQIKAKVYNRASNSFTSTLGLYTLLATESLAGVGDFNGDFHGDVVVRNNTANTLTFRAYQSATAISTVQLQVASGANFGTVGANRVLVGASEFAFSNSFDLIFLDTTAGNFQRFEMSMQQVLTPSIALATPPAGFSARGLWR